MPADLPPSVEPPPPMRLRGRLRIKRDVDQAALAAELDAIEAIETEHDGYVREAELIHGEWAPPDALPPTSFSGRDSDRSRLLAWRARLGHSGRLAFPSTRRRASEADHAAATLAAEALLSGVPAMGQRDVPVANVHGWMIVAERNVLAARKRPLAPWDDDERARTNGRGSGEFMVTLLIMVIAGAAMVGSLLVGML